MVHESEHGISNHWFLRSMLFLLAGTEVLSRYVRNVGVQKVYGKNAQPKSVFLLRSVMSISTK